MTPDRPSRAPLWAGARLGLVDRVAGYPNPFEAYLLAAAAVQGVVIALGVGRSTALESVLDDQPWLRWVWACLMTLGGLTALVGLYWRGDPFTAIEIKRVGLVSTGFGGLVYALALGMIGQPVSVAAFSAVAFSFACFTRTWQVTRLLRRAEAAVAAHREQS